MLSKSGEVPEKEMARVEAIINSMTPDERHNPDLLNGSRRARIAKGAGVTVQQVNLLVRQFDQMRQMMKGMLGGGKAKLPKAMRGLSPKGGRMPSMPQGMGMPGMGGMGMPGMGMPGMGMPGMPGGMPSEGMEGAGTSSAARDAKQAAAKKKKRKERRAARRK